MNYISVVRAAELRGVSARTARNYCATGKMEGAFLTGKTRNIPENAQRPGRVNRYQNIPKTLLDVLRMEKAGRLTGGICHKIQVEPTYNSNHFEGSRLTHDGTRFIYETNTTDTGNDPANGDDMIETASHFKCIDLVMEQANYPLRAAFIKQLHQTLKNVPAIPGRIGSSFATARNSPTK